MIFTGKLSSPASFAISSAWSPAAFIRKRALNFLLPQQTVKMFSSFIILSTAKLAKKCAPFKTAFSQAAVASS
jgi:hypothetical protein